MTIPPPNSEPDEPTTVPPVAAETPAKPHAPAVQKDVSAADYAASKTAVPKTSVRKAPVRKTPARTTSARTTAARPAPAKAAASGNLQDSPTPTPTPTPTTARSAASKATASRTAAAKSESATKASAARADTAKARAGRAAANRAAALASSLDKAVADSATPEAEVADLTVVEATVTEPAPAEQEAVVPAGEPTSPAEPDDSGAAAPKVETLETVETVEAPVKAVRTPRKTAARSPRSTTKRGAKTAPPVPEGPPSPVVLSVAGLKKRFGTTVAVSGIDLEVREGSFYGIVGPNGAGKTTTLSMITGLLRPDAGTVHVHGIDVWGSPIAAKRVIGVLPDRLRLFDRLTGAQLLYYSGVLRGLDGVTVRKRSADLAAAFGLEDALNRLVADYSAGMTKKIALACAMIHSPRVLVLDEPFESVDPVSAVNVTEILQKYVASGGTVVLSSHGMDLIQRVCDHVAIIVQGAVLAAGTIDEVRGENTLEERFIELAGGRKVAEGMEWLHSFSD